MIVLTKEQIHKLHKSLIDRYGGTQGVRDIALFDSATSAPFQTFEGKDLFPSITEKAVHLGFSLVKNHPFFDGNKRIGALAMLTTLDLNGISINTDNDDLTDIFLKVASNDADEKQLLSWVLDRIE